MSCEPLIREFLTRHPMVLASHSPRRASLLASAGFSFSVVPPDESVEATCRTSEDPSRMVVELAEAKARAVSALHPVCTVLAADTVAECAGQVLGKPRDADHARQMLAWLSGRKHRVLTGIALRVAALDRLVIHLEVSELQMDHLAPGLIDSYIAGGEWRGKAGGFGFQDGLDWLQLESGLASNVVGLPVERLPALLRQLSSGPEVPG